LHRRIRRGRERRPDRGAQLDLIGIGEYIRPHNPERAASVVDELLQHCHALAELPRRQPLVPRYEHHGIRRCVHADYLIFYRVGIAYVEVVHIAHGAQDYEPLLFPTG
jgi:plasmid stabilization system protein ParE